MAKQEERAAEVVVDQRVALGEVIQSLLTVRDQANIAATKAKIITVLVNKAQAKLGQVSEATLTNHFSAENIQMMVESAKRMITEYSDVLNQGDKLEKLLTAFMSAPITSPGVTLDSLGERMKSAAKARE